MERKQLESAAVDYSYLRGLFALPLGLLPVIAALGNWQWGPFRHTWFFLFAVGVIGLACLPIRRYYNENYGRVTLSTKQQTRAAVAAVLTIPVVFGGSFLTRSTVDWSLDLPVNTAAASFAVVMLMSYAAGVGLRAHHVAILGTLLVVGMLPVWNGGDPSNVGLVLAGVAIALTGVFDHRLLVRTFGTSTGVDLENSNARA